MNPTDVVTGNTTGDYSIAAGVSVKVITGISFASSQETTYIDFKNLLYQTTLMLLNVHNADFEEQP